jgi:broad specificity phosphatase PhoE
MPSRIFLIRHGQSTFNAAYEQTGVDPMLFDAPLSPLGVAQLEGARRQLAALPTPDIILSSPLTRALQTALGLFGRDGTKIEVSNLHHERLECSCDVGRSPTVLASEFPELRFDHLTDPWWHDGEPDERGIAIEPPSVFTERVDRFASWARSQHGKTVMVVGHAGFFQQLTGYRFANCEIRPW